jgi:CheY-like chemotaxis protein
MKGDTLTLPTRVRLKPRHAPDAERPLVLLAEDDPELRSLLAEALREDGCNVVEADDGFDALDYLAASLPADAPLDAPDLIVSDVQMPGMSGLQVVSWVRHLSAQVPVVLITAFGDAPIHQAAERLGGVAVLDKPFPLDKLRATVFGLATLDPR